MAKQKNSAIEPKPSVSAPVRSAESSQTLFTVLLLLHLFCLGIGVVSNVGISSPFRIALRNVPLVTDYLQLLGMDQGYDYPFTLGPPEAGNYRVRLKSVIEGENDVLLQFPDSSMQPGLRRQNYENLAIRIADLAEIYEGDPHHQTLLVAGLGKRLLQELKLPAGEYRLEIERREPQNLESISLGVAVKAPESVVEIFFLVDTAGEFQLALREEENLTATVHSDDSNP